MLDELGPWSSVYQRFRDWRNQRVFDQMLKRLQLKLNENGQIDFEDLDDRFHSGTCIPFLKKRGRIYLKVAFGFSPTPSGRGSQL
jgi:hypothetical protein